LRIFHSFHSAYQLFVFISNKYQRAIVFDFYLGCGVPLVGGEKRFLEALPELLTRRDVLPEQRMKYLRVKHHGAFKAIPPASETSSGKQKKLPSPQPGTAEKKPGPSRHEGIPRRFLRAAWPLPIAGG
jgi:hypothetical protein